MKKVSKHIKILKRRLNQSKELKRLSQIENQTLQQVVNAFILTKRKPDNKNDLDSFSTCENFRSKLLNDNTLISYEVFSSDRTATVQYICKNAASSKAYCRFLYYLVKSIENPIILEIGTNLGVSGCYLLEGMNGKNGKFVTMEGLPQLCEIASNQFSSIAPDSKFEVIQGLYDDTFPKVLEGDEVYNLIFIDGNHKKDPTIEYFKSLKTKIGEKAIFVFDDINWSKGMAEAWETIKADKDVNFSIDMYEQGIIIIDKSETKKNVEFGLHLSY